MKCSEIVVLLKLCCCFGLCDFGLGNFGVMQVVENRIELIKKLGDLKITEKSELASLAECLTVSSFSVNFIFLVEFRDTKTAY